MPIHKVKTSLFIKTLMLYYIALMLWPCFLFAFPKEIQMLNAFYFYFSFSVAATNF